MSKKILVVDDEPDMVTFLTTLLEDNGYATITAADGDEAGSRIVAMSFCEPRSWTRVLSS